MTNVFIGYDYVESVAWHTLAHSIYMKASTPVSIVPLKLSLLKEFYNRELDVKQSNEFSFSRFLVPLMMNFKGAAIFMDCDMLVRADITKLIKSLMASDEWNEKAVWVVKHEYKSKVDVKYLGNKQFHYPKKNWSSFVVWNCSHPANKILTSDFVSSSSGMELHRFQWLRDEEIGELDKNWNWLIGEYEEPNKSVKNLHWTIGGPYFSEFRESDCADEWFSMRDSMNNVSDY